MAKFFSSLKSVLSASTTLSQFTVSEILTPCSLSSINSTSSNASHNPSSESSRQSIKPNQKWFPKRLEDLNQVRKSIFEPGKDLISDHPGFSDASYVKRRREISEIAENFSVLTKEIPIVNYTKTEQATWSAIYDILTSLHKTHACEEYLANFEKLKASYGLSREKIPQLQEVSEYLQSTSGFRVIPITGMLTQRDFLSFLAFKIFTSTQYIRHGSDPLYSPEPDLVHEILGHVPMLANPEFAEFSQIIGLASLGASDEDIERLGKCYLFSVEFGLIRKQDYKIYGAGILSSAKELTNIVQRKPNFHYFQPEETCKFHCPLSDLQTDLFWSHSLTEAKEKMIQFVNKFEKGFQTSFDEVKQEVLVKEL